MNICVVWVMPLQLSPMICLNLVVGRYIFSDETPKPMHLFLNFGWNFSISADTIKILVFRQPISVPKQSKMAEIADTDSLLAWPLLKSPTLTKPSPTFQFFLLLSPLVLLLPSLYEKLWPPETVTRPSLPPEVGKIMILDHIMSDLWPFSVMLKIKDHYLGSQSWWSSPPLPPSLPMGLYPPAPVCHSC